MAETVAGGYDRVSFGERMRVQLASRYRDAEVEVDRDSFVVRLGGPGGASLSLAPLYQAVLRDPAAAPRLIASFVAAAEKQLGNSDPLELAPSRLLWCVRSQRDVEAHKRSGELLSVELGAGLVAFIAEALPASIMRGVPRRDWEGLRLSDAEVRRVATDNTARRFAKLIARIRGADRVPRDGWRMAGDPLFQGSVLMVEELLRALHHLAGGDVLVAVPDRGLVLAIAAGSAGAERFSRRLLREWREAMHPCSRGLLRYDGTALREVQRRTGRVTGVVMPWLQA